MNKATLPLQQHDFPQLAGGAVPAGVQHRPFWQTWLELHDTHAPPKLPQAAADWAPTNMHCPLAQQPLEQVLEVHTQLPLIQAVPGGQVKHAAPPLPHASGDVPGWQTPFEQQPDGQLAGLQPTAVQTPLVHAKPGPQETQAAPWEPQVVLLWLATGTQVPLLQQPPGQLVALQMQAPLTHV